MRGLYPIVDVDLLGRTQLAPVEYLEALLPARPALVQLRAKHLGARDTLALLRAFKSRTTPVGVKLFANDRPDLARLAGCDGVHLGQADFPPEHVRRWFGELMFGLSTHDPVQLEAALRHRPDYVAYGPVFGTQSKENPDAEVGLAGLRAAAHRVQGCCPLVAIGGITQATAREVGEIAELGSVIGALLPASSELAEVTARAEQLQLALGGRRG